MNTLPSASEQIITTPAADPTASVGTIAAQIAAACEELPLDTTNLGLEKTSVAIATLHDLIPESTSSLLRGVVIKAEQGYQSLREAQRLLAMGTVAFTTYLTDIGAAEADPSGSPIKIRTSAQSARFAARLEAAKAEERLNPFFVKGRTRDYVDGLCGLSDAALCELYRAGKPYADYVLITRHQTSLNRWASKIPNAEEAYGLERGDLWGVAAAVFLSACQTYSPASDSNLIAHADSKVQKAVEKEAHSSLFAIRVPLRFYQDVVIRVDTVNTQRIKNGKPPLTLHEIAALFGMPSEDNDTDDKRQHTVEDVQRILLLTRHLDSLQNPYLEGEPKRSLAGPRLPAFFEAEAALELREAIAEVLTTLTERERDFVLARHGFIDGAPRTQTEAGEVIGAGNRWAQLLDQRSLKKLRHPSRADILKDYY